MGGVLCPYWDNYFCHLQGSNCVVLQRQGLPVKTYFFALNGMIFLSQSSGFQFEIDVRITN
jgi:hypothetical protein